MSPPARRGQRTNAAQRGRAQIFRGIHAGAGHFGRHGDMDFLAIPQHSQLLEHFNLLQRARRPADIAADKAGAIAIDADVTQQGVTDGLAGLGKAIAIQE